MKYCFLAASVAVISLAAPAGASLGQQRQTAPESAEIVVTGTRDVDRQLSDFVGALAPARPGGQLGRFESAVCPAVLGLAPSHKIAVERRLRVVAKAAGMDVAPEGCSINSLLMVADDKKEFIKALQNRHPRYLGNLTVSDTRRLLRAPGPTASWQLTGMVSERGIAVDGSVGDLGFINRTTEPPSRITAATRPVFEASALVVERGALSGLTTTQLADYAAMRLFAKMEPDRLAGSTAPTIVTVIDAPVNSEVPLSLTTWDLGLLRGLYAGPGNAHSAAQRSGIAQQIAKEIAQPKAAGE